MLIALWANRLLPAASVVHIYYTAIFSISNISGEREFFSSQCLQGGFMGPMKERRPETVFYKPCYKMTTSKQAADSCEQ